MLTNVNCSLQAVQRPVPVRGADLSEGCGDPRQPLQGRQPPQLQRRRPGGLPGRTQAGGHALRVQRLRPGGGERPDRAKTGRLVPRVQLQTRELCLKREYTRISS